MDAKFTGLGLALGILLLGSGLQVDAERTNIASASSVLLKGGVYMEVGQPSVQKLAPLEMGETGRSLEIDRQVRTIGGERDLSNAAQKQLPAQKFPFFINPADVKGKPQLIIGYIRGINTPEAHATGQSSAGFVSSPAVIKVNGVRIHYLYTDGDMITIQIPRSVLKADGFNVLQVEAGFYFLPGNQLAYDQLELQHLALHY